MTDTQSKTAGSEVAKASILAEAAEIAMGGWHSVEKARAFACSVSDYLLSTQAGALQAVDSEWSGWACQKPGKLPRLYGALEIAELNLDEDDAEDRLIFLSTQRALTSAEIDALPAEQWFKWRESRASRKDREAAAAVSSAEEDAHSPNCDIFTGGRACNCGAALATTQPDAAPTAEVVELLAYVLQDEQHNRLTPRVIDIAYTAFMLAKQPNTEDGGSSDWFNDTRPAVRKAVEKLRNDFAALAAPAAAIDAREQELPSHAELLALYRRCEQMAGGLGMLYYNYAREVFSLASRSASPAARPNAAGQEQVHKTCRMDDGRCGMCGGDWSVCGCEGMLRRKGGV